MLSGMIGAFEISGAADGLLDDDLVLRVRGAGPETDVTWRARFRDDDGRVWRAAASRAEDLTSRWVAAKDSAGPIAALRSLRPLSIDVRAELDDGRGAGRTLTRRLVGDGVRIRRWRDGLAATLHLPAASAGPRAVAEAQGQAAPGSLLSDPVARALAEGVGPLDAQAQAAPGALLIDATAGGAAEVVAVLAGALLASRGVVALVVGPARGRSASADPVGLARERLAALPAAAGEILVLPALDPFAANAPPGGGIVLPAGVGARDPQHAAAARTVAWDALLHRLAASPRRRAAAPAPSQS
jgi:hypothetical protein